MALYRPDAYASANESWLVSGSAWPGQTYDFDPLVPPVSSRRLERLSKLTATVSSSFLLFLGSFSIISLKFLQLIGPHLQMPARSEPESVYISTTMAKANSWAAQTVRS
jgi:hypothetical protein